MTRRPRGGVELGGRLVGNEHVRFERQCARDRDALLLATGEVVDQMIGELGQPDVVESRTRQRTRGSRGVRPDARSAASTFSRAVNNDTSP